MQAQSVQVSTTQYEFAHGRRPRGDGSWAFFFGAEVDARWYQGSYREARRQAVRDAVSMGVGYVRVGS